MGTGAIRFCLSSSMNLDEFGNSAQANDATMLGHLYATTWQPSNGGNRMSGLLRLRVLVYQVVEDGMGWKIQVKRYQACKLYTHGFNILYVMFHFHTTELIFRFLLFSNHSEFALPCDETFTPQRPWRSPLLLDANRAKCSTPSRGQPVPQLDKIRLGYNLCILLICM